MVGYRTPEQLREQHIKDMGPELGPIYNALTNDVTWLHAKWNQYRQLYAHSPERVTLLNEVGGFFFRIVQDTLFENVALHVARLADPPRTRNKDNLSLQRLSEAIHDSALAADVRGLVNTALAACKSFRAWRHRSIAHRDLTLVLATSSDPLPGVSRAEVESALAAIRAVLNRLETHYWQSEIAYEHFIPRDGDTDSLIYYLEAGMKTVEARQSRDVR